MPAIVGKKFSVERVFSSMKEQQFKTYNQKYDIWCVIWPHKIMLGESNHSLTKSLRVFYRLGLKCRFCGLEATYFQQERFSFKKSWHLVPYAIAEDGAPVKITKDHIIPKTAGGPKTNLLNLQVLCNPCNEYKENMVPAAFPSKLQEMLHTDKKDSQG